MKVFLRLLFYVGVICVFTTSSNSQVKLRKIEEFQKSSQNQPIRIRSSFILDQRVADDGTVTAGPDWIGNLQFRVENVSSKNILYFRIGLVVDTRQPNPSRVEFPVVFGVPLWIDLSGKVKASDRKVLLRPSESTVVSVSPNDARILGAAVKKYRTDDISILKIEIQSVHFDDFSGWSYGHEYQRDPENPRVIKNAPYSLWQKVTDFF